VLPERWDLPVVAAGVVVEAVDSAFWFRWSRRRRATVGPEALVGTMAEVVEALDPVGRVKVNGELWNARMGASEDPPLEAGALARIVAIEELTLVVEPAG
jgi:membrane protein implicated in regulation of membrane protease activity